MQKIKDLIIKNKELIRQLFMYGIIGGISALLDVVAFYFLSKSMGLVISNIISVNIGIACSFLANTFINFKVTDKLFKRFISFFSVGYLGLAISSGLLYVGVNFMGIDKLYVKIFTVFFVAIIQFVLNKLITFRKGDADGQAIHGDTGV